MRKTKGQFETLTERGTELVNKYGLPCDLDLFDAYKEEDTEFFDDGSYHVVRDGVRFCFGFNQDEYPNKIPDRMEERCIEITEDTLSSLETVGDKMFSHWTSTQLKEEAKNYHELIYKLGCYGMKDTAFYERILAELERRGVKVNTGITFE